MRTITLIIIYCSVTPEGKSLSAETCHQDHTLHRRFRNIGYHPYIARDGKVYQGCPLEKIGAHCRGHNIHSIGIHYKERLDMTGRLRDTCTLTQRVSSLGLLRELRKIFPKTLIIGHRNLNPIKERLCFNYMEEHQELSGIT